MKPTGMDRREFHQLTVAALGGVIAGTTIGCNPAPTAPPAKMTTTPSLPAAVPIAQVTLTPEMEALIMDEPHTCRGLNSCKGKGRSQDNECAGQGTFPASPMPSAVVTTSARARAAAAKPLE